MEDIRFSVIIPSYNEALVIEKCITSVLANLHDNVNGEIIVVDNGSLDGTVDIVKKLGIKIIENNNGKRNPIGVLRNIGVKESSGNLLAFLDGDMIIPHNWLLKAKEYFDKGFEGALGFTEGVPDSAGWIARTWGNRIYQKLDKIVDVSYLTGRNMIIKRTVFEEMCGFDENLKTNEDKDLSIRLLKAGYRLISIPETGVFHMGYEKNLWEFMKKEFWRQGSSLAAAQHTGLSLRTLRAPLLSLWHISVFPFFILSFFFAGQYISILLFLAWVGPSFFITFTKLVPGRPFPFRAAFLLLTFLRWNVSGLALLWQLINWVSSKNR